MKTNKRLISSIAAIIFASITTCIICIFRELDSASCLEVFKNYMIIVVTALGGYQVSQTFTDHKKITNGKE